MQAWPMVRVGVRLRLRLRLRLRRRLTWPIGVAMICSGRLRMRSGTCTRGANGLSSQAGC